MKHYKVYFDGAAVPSNPSKQVYYGYAVFDDTKQVDKGLGAISKNGDWITNNEAEYWGLIKALEGFRALGLAGSATFYGDSQLIINQVNGVFRCNKPHLKALLDLVDLGSFSLVWIKGKDNLIAHNLAHRAYKISTQEGVK